MDESWRDEALCAQIGFIDFHPDKHDHGMARINIAKRICSMCDVQKECLEYSLVIADDHGVWGGMTPKERQRLRKRMGIKKPEKDWHGTARGARRHRENGERPCQLCVNRETEESRLSRLRAKMLRDRSA
jgi:WhiB family transcriptional regulator, redox-sensing transcriptional regulator